MKLFGRNPSDRRGELRKTADKHRAAGIKDMQAGRATPAATHLAAALAAVEELKQLEPHDPEHAIQIAGLRYNIAGARELAGDLDGAVRAAREAYDGYFAVFFELGPSSYDELGLLVADSQMRLGRLTARRDGAPSAETVRTLCDAAVETYESMARDDPRQLDGLARIRRLAAEAESFLGVPRP
jgi:hypothetical protein